MCIGHLDKMRRLEKSERQLNWMIYSSFGDPTKMPDSPQKWWPIEGEVIPKIKVPSRSKLVKLESIFKNIGKHG